MSLLKVKNLSQSYGGLKVLEGVSFSLEAGERVAFIGPNGAGKTTLLNVLSGLLPSIAGRIYILDQDVTKMSPHKRVSLGLARSFQLNTLFTNISLLNNILLAVQGTKTSRFQIFRPISTYSDTFAEAKELLQSVGLWEKRDAIISSLSYGEQRQVEILLALASKPKILLMDEPSAGLDIDESKNLSSMIRSLAKDIAVLFSAHDMELVFTLADRVTVLYYGKIIAQGTREEIQSDSKVRQIYLGTQGIDARVS